MDVIKQYTDEYFLNYVAKFCMNNKVENVNFILKIEIIWKYTFFNWGEDFGDFLDAYADYKYRIEKRIF